MQTLFSEDEPMAKKTTKKKTKKKTARKKKAEQPLTTAQQLGSLIKSARDIMRKDKGLNGDLDRLPMLTWIMFLKFLDDMEQVDEEATKLAGKKYKPVLEPPYRWRDWAAKADGITGDELIAFVNQEEAVRPDGSKGAGLLAYLRSLQSSNGKNRRDVVAQVFSGVVNRMISGYLLRDVINKVDGIHFSSSEELHTLGALYESMLREMRDAAGDSGEFYTPRAVIQFMVAVTNPQLGETVLDPACGTGGFLAEAYEHLAKQVETTKDRRVLQEESLLGQEAKPLPYMLGQMNLLLHGLEYPSIAYGNTLARKVTEIGDRDRVDVILTNPPFGGEEEAGIKNNFPADKQTSETALLFLQLIMRLLKRPEKNNGAPGRAAVVVPNGTLYEKGIAETIRRELLTGFCLEAVVRLPKGVFEPYTDIATNLLFFRRGEPQDVVWFYEHPLPPHRAHLKGRSYSATDGIRDEEFQPHIEWWQNKADNDVAWAVSREELLANGCDLALIHPKHERVELPLATDIISSVSTSVSAVPHQVKKLGTLLQQINLIDADPVPLEDLLSPRTSRIRIENGTTYRRPRVQLHFRGAKLRDEVPGDDIGTRTQTIIHTNDLIMSRIDARNGAMAIVPSELDGAIATNDFPVFEIRTDRLLPSYLRFVLFQPQMLAVYERLSRGSTNRRRMDVDEFLQLRIPLPDPDTQIAIAEVLEKAEDGIAALRETLANASEELSGVLASALHATFGDEQGG